MIDLNKAGAWDAKEQLELAELLRNPTFEMIRAGASKLMVLKFEDKSEFGEANSVFEAMIDAATGGESDVNAN